MMSNERSWRKPRGKFLPRNGGFDARDISMRCSIEGGRRRGRRRGGVPVLGKRNCTVTHGKLYSEKETSRGRIVKIQGRGRRGHESTRARLQAHAGSCETLFMRQLMGGETLRKLCIYHVRHVPGVLTEVAREKGEKIAS